MTLEEVRKNIDVVDQKIKELFEERMKLADNVARVKAETEDKIFKPDREVAIIKRLTEGVDESIKFEYTALIKRIMEVSRKYQYGRTLALRDCFDIDYKVIEESATGLEKGGEPIKLVCLHDERALIEETLKGDGNEYHFFEAPDTEEFSRRIKSADCDGAAGVMEEIGYDVSAWLDTILCENKFYISRCHIASDMGRQKKIVIFSDKLTVRPDDNRLKVMFVCPNRSGSLASILSMIADYGVNLTEIHSKADHREIWNYYFIAEITASLLNERDRALIYQLESETEEFRILGSYKVNEG